jgi:hypothetical protein
MDIVTGCLAAQKKSLGRVKMTPHCHSVSQITKSTVDAAGGGSGGGLPLASRPNLLVLSFGGCSGAESVEPSVVSSVGSAPVEPLLGWDGSEGMEERLHRVLFRGQKFPSRWVEGGSRQESVREGLEVRGRRRYTTASLREIFRHSSGIRLEWVVVDEEKADGRSAERNAG